MPHTTKMLFATVATLCLLACGGEELNTTPPEPTSGGQTPGPSPSPTPTPPTSSKDGLVQLDIVESGLNVEEWLIDTGIPKSAAPDVLGAFRFLCAPSHLSYDDPIVHPGKPGAAHLHQFFGNTMADANSTYESLRKTGDSTCTNVLNRSAYWMPALLDGQGSVVVPNYVAVYYKMRPGDDEYYKTTGTQAVMIPRGLRYVFGDSDNKPVFKCAKKSGPSIEDKSMATLLSQCEPGEKFIVRLKAPGCWDGKNLDASDHRAHMKHMIKHGNGLACPDTHPNVVAAFTMNVEWSVKDGDIPTLWRFSSDMGDVAPGSTFHADWFGAWEDEVLAMWHDGCIDELLNCADGNLGIGKIMKRNELYPSGEPETRKIALHTIQP